MGLQRGQKNDRLDAYRIAEQLRIGALSQRVFKAPRQFSRLRELSRGHTMLVRDAVRVQGRIKSIFRSRGVSVPGSTVYNPLYRHDYLDMLPEHCRDLAAMLLTQYDLVMDVRKQAEKLMIQESKRHAIARVLRTCPGLGDIRVARLMPIVVTPHRFRTKRQFWSYCGLGIVMRTSADWARQADGGWVRDNVPRTRGLNRRHNKVLKDVFKGAANTALQCDKYPELRAVYDRLCDGGTKPSLARLTIARKIAAISLAMWKHKEVYDPKVVAST